MNDFLINGGVPFSVYGNMWTNSDSNISFKLHGDLIETMTHYDFTVSHSNPKNQKLFYEFEKEMNFIVKQKRRKSNRDKTLI